MAGTAPASMAAAGAPAEGASAYEYDLVVIGGGSGESVGPEQAANRFRLSASQRHPNLKAE